MQNRKKLFVKTYGCQMNVYDSERMGQAMASAGYDATDRAEDADFILLNTCHIRKKRRKRSIPNWGVSRG